MALRVQNRRFTSKSSQRLPVSLLVLSVFAILMPQLASAQTPPKLLPSLEPLETELLEPGVQLAGRNIVTRYTISQRGITAPSLWWAKEQFNEFKGKLLDNWIAYQDKKRIDLVVNRQLWSILDYLERYRFVNEFGSVARDYKYNLRVFNQQGVLLATYTCDYSTTPPNCNITISGSSGEDSLQLRSRQPQN